MDSTYSIGTVTLCVYGLRLWIHRGNASVTDN